MTLGKDSVNGLHSQRSHAMVRGMSYGRPTGELLDLKLSLTDMMKAGQTPPSPANSWYSWSVYEKKPTFSGGVTRANVNEKIVNFKLGERQQALRERLTEDISFDTKRERPRRLSHQQYGQRVGDFVEYERFRRNKTTEQRFWDRRERQERPHAGTIAIHIDNAIMGWESQDSLEWTGATGLALTDLLESMGYSAVLRIADGNDGNHRPIHMSITLKDAGEPLTDFAVAVACSGGIYRYLMFALYASREDMVCAHGMGNAVDYRGSDKADVTIPRSVRSEETAIAFIENMLNKYRKDLEDQEQE